MDLVYVSYNSKRWIRQCFDSLLQSQYDLKKIAVYVVDNGSKDGSLTQLKAAKQKCSGRVKSFELIEAKENLGFGRANNLGAEHGTDPIICFFNIDTRLYPDTLSNLYKEIRESDKSWGLWELRQFPYEHPKLYDALTHETGWSSGAAFAVRRRLYEKIGGFDEEIFLYAEDVDLSWRLRSYGYKLKYVPKAVITHDSYRTAGEVKPAQHVNGVMNNLLLRYRFGGIGSIVKGHVLFLKCMMSPAAFPGAKTLLLQSYLRHFAKIKHFRDPHSYGRAGSFFADFIGFDYSGTRDGAFYKNQLPKEHPLVSIIVRTCQRQAVLRETLLSLRSQTYPNIEIVVVQDGKETAGKMIREEFSDLNILYFATGKRTGRSRAGNMAMEKAHGTYLNFLDDDDLFYADHVEVLVHTLLHSENRAAYAFAFQTPITVKSLEPYVYELEAYEGIHKQTFDKIMLCHHNYIPIQCMMFEKSLFEQYGGLDESLDALEDWDLWVRYSLHTDFTCVEKTTSIYRVPKDRKKRVRRQKVLDDALEIVREKHKGYLQRLRVDEIAGLYQTKS